MTAAWQERVQVGQSAPRAQEILIPGENWQLVAEGFKSTRGPACNSTGEVFFADTSNNRIHRIDLDGTVSEFVADAGPTQVILPVPDGSRVIGVCLGGKDGDTLFAFCGNRIWKRKVQHHATGAFMPWTKVIGTKL